MKPEIIELIEISKYYGKNKDFVVAGGGNTSFKDDDTIWIKASGQHLALMNEDGLVALNRQKLQAISTSIYSEDPHVREEQVKEDMFRSITDRGIKKRPSFEAELLKEADWICDSLLNVPEEALEW
jgi:rhamnose utilization protein RhaD (predicted bifunctional aldolase and dehydrogenase)